MNGIVKEIRSILEGTWNNLPTVAVALVTLSLLSVTNSSTSDIGESESDLLTVSIHSYIPSSLIAICLGERDSTPRPRPPIPPIPFLFLSIS
jgi:hypothetical protein